MIEDSLIVEEVDDVAHLERPLREAEECSFEVLGSPLGDLPLLVPPESRLHYVVKSHADHEDTLTIENEHPTNGVVLHREPTCAYVGSDAECLSVDTVNNPEPPHIFREKLEKPGEHGVDDGTGNSINLRLVHRSKLLPESTLPHGKIKSMHEIIPAILPTDAEDLVSKANSLPLEIPFIHFDVLEEDIWAPIEKSFEVHLMVEDPAKIATKWIERGAKRIIVHKVDETLTKCRDKAEVGLGVEIDKSLDEFAPFLDFVDFVHLMSIKEIGHQGHPFDNRVFDRIKEVKAKFPKLPISVDGGISLDNYKQLQEAGADRLIVGSHFREIWNSLTQE